MHCSKSTIVLIVLTLSSGCLASNTVDRFSVFKAEVRRRSSDLVPFQKLFALMLGMRATFELTVSDPEWSENELRLYNYNIVREMLQMPLASTTENIDINWIYMFSNAFLDAHFMHRHDAIAAGPQTKQMVTEAARSCNLQQAVIALRSGMTFSWGRSENLGLPGIHTFRNYVIYFDSVEDRDIAFFITYHELGHIAYNHTGEVALVNQKKLTFSEVLEKDDFKIVLKKIKLYLELAIKLLPFLEKTIVGSHLAEVLEIPEIERILKEYGFLWVIPEDPNQYQKTTYLRFHEQAADLFACSHLLKLKKIDTILNFIDWMAFSEPREEPHIVTDGNNVHPSDVERALYILGFLVYHVPHLAQVIEAWENTGKCLAAERDSNADGIEFEEPALLQAKIVYRDWKDKQPIDFAN